MKKLLLSGMLLLSGLYFANAQEYGLADGTSAPDFTVTDINGGTHHLNEYLDSGKTVILYCSAAWCGPCWQFHNTHYLADIYEAYGEGGSDDVIILYVETDPRTPVNHLYGIDSPANFGNPNPPQGDWTIGTPYPIIDSDQIAEDYNVQVFPTIYKICPEGRTTKQIERDTPANMVIAMEEDCHDFTGVTSHAQLSSGDTRVCETNGIVKASFINLGTDAIATATLQLKTGETVVSTKPYSGNLSQFGTASVSFDALDLDPSVDYTVTFSDINGSAPYSSTLATTVTDVILANESNNNLRIDVHTDNYPKEISWKLKDSEGTVVASGGPYVGDTNGGGADAMTVKTQYVNLTEGSIDCYSLEMKDSYGDGWALTSLDFAGIKIYSTQGEVFSQSATDSFKTKIVDSVVKTTGVLSTPELQATQFAVFPNPSNGIFNFTTNEAVDVTVTDLTGKTVFTAQGIDNGGSINLSTLAKGMYIAKIKGATAERTEKLVIK